MMSPIYLCVMTAAVIAALMAGSLHIRVNLWLYALETVLIATATALTGFAHNEIHLLIIAFLLGALKSCCIPMFLVWTLEKLRISRDIGAVVTPPLAMHASVLLFALSFWLTRQLPQPASGTEGWLGAAAGISLVFTGLVLMLTRRLAISQILGFLVSENGIFVFTLTQTHGMPLFVEMGIMLDVLVGVMIGGLLTFKIHKSFEHIDVAQLTDLRD